MPTTTPDEARARIVDVIGDSVYQALGLKEALEDERKALESQNIEALDAIVGTKSRCAEQLMVIAAEGSALNMINGAIIGLRQQQFDASIAVLRGAATESSTYDRSGADGSDHHRRSLAEA